MVEEKPKNTMVNRDSNGRFVKGNPGSPGRPPKDCSLTSLLKVELDNLCPEDTTGKTWREVLVLAWLKGCLSPGKGQGLLLKELLDRVEGKVVLPIGGDPDNPIKIAVIEVVKDYGEKVT